MHKGAGVKLHAARTYNEPCVCSRPRARGVSASLWQVVAVAGAVDAFWALAAFGDLLTQWEGREREGAGQHNAARRLARSLGLGAHPSTAATGAFAPSVQRWGVPVVASGAFQVPTLAEIAAELEA